MKKKLQTGDIAPDFKLTATGGLYGDSKNVCLSSLRGQTVVLYFYPKDDTPGCTIQACGVRDNYSAFDSRGALVFGVSGDTPESHAKFISKHSLPFPLLSDVTRQVLEAYGVWIEKSMYGKKYMGIERSTFVINPDGKIRSIYRKIQPSIHASTILKDL